MKVDYHLLSRASSELARVAVQIALTTAILDRSTIEFEADSLAPGHARTYKISFIGKLTSHPKTNGMIEIVVSTKTPIGVWDSPVVTVQGRAQGRHGLLFEKDIGSFQDSKAASRAFWDWVFA